MAVLNDLKYEPNKGVPNNPLLKNWQVPTVKRALREAVDSGADYFAWINGSQTSARYNLATQVDSVKWESNKAGYDGKKQIYVNAKSGRDIIVKIDEKGNILNGKSVPSDWVGKPLDSALGKGLADKIMEKETGTLSGEGLSFGGEWASNLYDKQVKSIVEDLTGGKVEVMDLGLPVEKVKQWKIEKQSSFDPSYSESVGDLTSKNLKVGIEIRNPDNASNYIITDVLGDGKFKAVPKRVFEERVRASWHIVRERGSDGSTVFIAKNRNTGATKTAKTSEEAREFIETRTSDSEKFASDAEQFDISQKKATQQGIKLTPEIKAIVRGEAPFKGGNLNMESGFINPPALGLISLLLTGATAIANIPKNKTTYTAPKENPLLKEKQPLTDEKLGKALMQLESSGGKNKKNADSGEMKWLVGLTQDAIDELKRLKRLPKNFNKNNKDQVVKAGIEYFKLMQERNPKMTPAEVYVDKYWTQWKTETERTKKMIEFQNLISVENS